MVMPFLISSFESIFEDMGVQLPWLTQAVLAVPDIAWIVVGAAGVVAIVAKDRVVSSGVALVFNAVVFLVGATFVAAAVVGLIVPLLEITRSIE